MHVSILPKTYLESGKTQTRYQRGVLDGRPLEIEVQDAGCNLCPITIISAGEVLLTLSKADARLLACSLQEAARFDRQA